MSKHAKTALFLLYVLQLVVVFRDPLGQLYSSTIETVRHEMTSHDEGPRTHVQTGHSGPGWRDVLHVIVSIAKPHGPELLLVAATGPNAFISEDHGEGHVHPLHENHDSFNGDRRRRRRERIAWGYLIRNLFAEIRSIAAAPSATEPRIRVTSRTTFPT